MPDRPWPVHRARAWLLRKAAGLVGSKYDACANAFAVEACGAADNMHDNEESFRVLCSENIEAFGSLEEIDRAVAEVYGDASGGNSPGDVPPIPLSAPDGRVYAFACPRCHHVANRVSLGVRLNGPSEHLAESSRMDADRCCRCNRCRAPLGNRGIWQQCCVDCKPAADAEQEERYARIAAADAAEDAAREQSLIAAKDRDAATLLVQLMREISEECYCAGWMMGLEHALWGITRSDRREYGQSEVSEAQVSGLLRLSEKAGGWWLWDDARGGEMFVPTEDWERNYAQR